MNGFYDSKPDPDPMGKLSVRGPMYDRIEVWQAVLFGLALLVAGLWFGHYVGTIQAESKVIAHGVMLPDVDAIEHADRLATVGLRCGENLKTGDYLVSKAICTPPD